MLKRYKKLLYGASIGIIASLACIGAVRAIDVQIKGTPEEVRQIFVGSEILGGWSAPATQPYVLTTPSSTKQAATTTQFMGDVEPYTSGAYDLGDYNFPWRNVYASGTIYSSGSAVLSGGITESLIVGNGVSSSTINGSSTSTYPYGATFATSGGNVGIGTANTEGMLHILKSSAGTVTAPTTANVIVESGAVANGLSFLSPNTATQYIYFGDADDNDIGDIRYNHTDNSLRLTTNAGGGYVHLTSGGNFGIGTTPTTKLDVQGAVSSTNVYANNGLISAPGFAFAEDQNSGMFLAAADLVGIVGGGSAATYFYSGGVRPNTNGNSSLGLSNFNWRDLYLSGIANLTTIMGTSLNLGNGTTTSTLNYGARGSATSTFYSDIWVNGRDLMVGGDGIASGNFWIGNGQATTTIRGGVAGSATSTFEGDVSIPNLFSGPVQFDTDGGVMDWANIPVSNAAATTTREGYNFLVDNIPVWNVMGSSDALGSVYNLRVGMTDNKGMATTTFQAPSNNATSTFYFGVKESFNGGIGTCFGLNATTGGTAYISVANINGTLTLQASSSTCENAGLGLKRD